MKVIIFGSNGFLGRVLSDYFVRERYEVVAIARRRAGCSSSARFVSWDGQRIGDWTEELDGADAVINLAGRTVNCRYNEKNKRQIIESRTVTTELIGSAIKGLKNPPEVWLNSSTATIYEHRERGQGNEPHTEADGVVGEDFSMGVAKEWEKAFYSDEMRVRKVALRTAIVLGAVQGTVFDKLSGIVKLGLGGRMGSGSQMVSWIHEEDFCRAVEFLVREKSLAGSINIVAPKAEKNVDFMRELRRVWGMPLGLPATKWMLKIGTFIMRTEAELVLKSRWVYPKRLEEAGFSFSYPDVRGALEELKERFTKD